MVFEASRFIGLPTPPLPKVGLSPALLGTPAVQFPASDQLSSSEPLLCQTPNDTRTRRYRRGGVWQSDIRRAVARRRDGSVEHSREPLRAEYQLSQRVCLPGSCWSFLASFSISFLV